MLQRKPTEMLEETRTATEQPEPTFTLANLKVLQRPRSCEELSRNPSPPSPELKPQPVQENEQNETPMEEGPVTEADTELALSESLASPRSEGNPLSSPTGSVHLDDLQEFPELFEPSGPMSAEDLEDLDELYEELVGSQPSPVDINVTLQEIKLQADHFATEEIQKTEKKLASLSIPKQEVKPEVSIKNNAPAQGPQSEEKLGDYFARKRGGDPPAQNRKTKKKRTIIASFSSF